MKNPLTQENISDNSLSELSELAEKQVALEQRIAKGEALLAELGRELRYASFTTEDFKYRVGVYDRLIRDVFDFDDTQQPLLHTATLLRTTTQYAATATTQDSVVTTSGVNSSAEYSLLPSYPPFTHVGAHDYARKVLLQL